MILSYPCLITSRLLPGVQVADASISISYHGTTNDGRTEYAWSVDLADGREFSGHDLASGVGGGSLHSGLVSLLSFLGAAGESVNYAEQNGKDWRNDPDSNANLFAPELAEWCAANCDELGMISADLELTPDAIAE